MKIRAYIDDALVTEPTIRLSRQETHRLRVEVLDGDNKAITLNFDDLKCQMSRGVLHGVPSQAGVAALYTWHDPKIATITCTYGAEKVRINVVPRLIGLLCFALVAIAITTPLLLISIFEAFVQVGPDLQKWHVAFKNLVEIFGLGTSLIVGVQATAEALKIRSLSPFLAPLFDWPGRVGIAFSVALTLFLCFGVRHLLYHNGTKLSIDVGGQGWKAGEIWLLSGAENLGTPLCTGDGDQCVRPGKTQVGGSSSWIASHDVGCDRWWPIVSADPPLFRGLRVDVSDGCRKAIIVGAGSELEFRLTEGKDRPPVPTFKIANSGPQSDAVPTRMRLKWMSSEIGSDLRLDMGPGRNLSPAVELHRVGVTFSRTAMTSRQPATIVTPMTDGRALEISVGDAKAGSPQLGSLTCGAEKDVTLLLWMIPGDSIARAAVLEGVKRVSSWEPQPGTLQSLLALCVPNVGGPFTWELTFTARWQPDTKWSIQVPAVVDEVVLRLANGRMLGTINERVGHDPDANWTLESHYLTTGGSRYLRTTASRPFKYVKRNDEASSSTRVVRKGPGKPPPAKQEWWRAQEEPGVFGGWFWMGRGSGKCSADIGYGRRDFDCSPGVNTYPGHDCYFNNQGIEVPQCQGAQSAGDDEKRFKLGEAIKGCTGVFVCRT